MTDDVASQAAEYERLATLRDQTQGNPARANVLFDEMHKLAKTLRATEGGRAGVEGLLTHEVVAVRLSVAAEVLAWSPLAAVPVLEAIEKLPGLHAVSAKYTLRSYRSGHLDLDW